MYRYLRIISDVGSSNYIHFLKSKGWSDENNTAPITSDYNLNPQLGYLGTKTRAEFKQSCLKQNKITYDLGKIVNIYIVYEINKSFNIIIYPTLKLGAVSLTKNYANEKYKYSGYGIGFGRYGLFSHPSGGTGRNLVIFEVDMS